jgi:hypothetical protein
MKEELYENIKKLKDKVHIRKWIFIQFKKDKRTVFGSWLTILATTRQNKSTALQWVPRGREQSDRLWGCLLGNSVIIFSYSSTSICWI